MSDVVIFSANRGYALRSSREGIINRLLKNGYKVVLATADDKESRYLCSLGATLEPIVFSRGGVSLKKDFKAYTHLKRLLKKYEPKLIHNFHSKPVILGSLAARTVSGSRVAIVNSITGLGHAFMAGGLAANMAGFGYKLALPSSDMTIFQNSDDQKLFVDKKWVRENQYRLILGSGTNVEKFSYIERGDRDKEAPVVIMLGRLLGQKGIPEFIEVAKSIRKKWPRARFLWAGEEDGVHPDSVSAHWLTQQAQIEYVGLVEDVPSFMQNADLLVFSSYYREGVPRVIMEAAATGLPTVAFDVPGVREAVRSEETGFLVAPHDVEEMTSRVGHLIEDKSLREKLGRLARQFAERKFDIENVQAAYFDVYRELGINI